MILPIHLYGSPVLRKKGVFIKERTNDLESLIENMFDTLKESDGVGLASHQVGESYKLFIIDYSSPELERDRLQEIFINLEILESSKKEGYLNEGCLSLPGILEEVKRPTSIKVKYLNGNFEKKEAEFTGFIARVIQHEFDHTNGIYFIDKIHPLKKKLIKKKLINILKRKIKIPYKHK